MYRIIVHTFFHFHCWRYSNVLHCMSPPTFLCRVFLHGNRRCMRSQVFCWGLLLRVVISVHWWIWMSEMTLRCGLLGRHHVFIMFQRLLCMTEVTPPALSYWLILYFILLDIYVSAIHTSVSMGILEVYSTVFLHPLLLMTQTPHTSLLHSLHHVA